MDEFNEVDDNDEDKKEGLVVVVDFEVFRIGLEVLEWDTVDEPDALVVILDWELVTVAVVVLPDVEDVIELDEL